ncbi:MAG: hypothetical protein VX447_09170 [Pseudomonadota bacterium]|uniref:hypothetical protein n=1 Tax=Gallaecimonas pentaromativorans TaxID=584787 RepID=UPI00067EA9CE|nr:hypothetical protein [Gallaecimonas pentaromativorans]MED5524908.1 hypothetical protein [Pseudomonadota bacterium]
MKENDALREFVRNAMKEKGISFSRLAELCFDDELHQGSVAQLAENIKKQLQRPSTSRQKLEWYLEVLNSVGAPSRPPPLAREVLGADIYRTMVEFSRDLDQRLAEDE